MVTGVIAEYNPFHKGHALHLAAARKAGGGPVVVVLSGSFVQRGEPALLSKQSRAEMALKCGADLVLELPLPWAMSTAQNFAEGGVGLLQALGCVQALSFGCECGDESLLAAAAVGDPALKPILDGYLGRGLSFAAARERAVSDLYGPKTAAVLSRPNDTLAVEYLSAADRLGTGWKCLPVPRVGAAHDAPADARLSVHGQSENNRQFLSADGLPGLSADGLPALSASALRALVLSGKTEEAKAHMPAAAAIILERESADGRIARPSRLETALLARLRCMEAADFARLPDVSEGLENRLYAAARRADSFAALCAAVKAKRYSLARIRRILYAAFLGLDNRYFRRPVPYLRVLGFTAAGLPLIQSAKKAGRLPLLLRAKDLEGLDRTGRDVFQSECRADDLFWLAADRPRPCGTNLTEPVIRL